MDRTVKVSLGLVTMGLLAVLGCGDGGSSSHRVDDGAGEGASEGEGEGCTAEALVGTWSGSAITLTFAADATFHAVGANQAMYDVTGSYAVDGCEVSLRDLAGTHPCPADPPGVYGFAISGTELMLTQVQDACEGRVMGAAGKTFSRQ